MTSKKAYYQTRKPFTPEHGVTYQNEGGGVYECVDFTPSQDHARFRNVKSGWYLSAHGVGIYEDGKIDWDYSTDGTF